MRGLDPRLFGAPNGGAQQVANGDAVARDEIAKLKAFVAQRVGADIATLSSALAALNKHVEQTFAQQLKAFAMLAQRVAQLESVVAQMVSAAGGIVERSGEATPGEVVESPAVREAANVQPGDENLPPEYFQGAGDEEAI